MSWLCLHVLSCRLSEVAAALSLTTIEQAFEAIYNQSFPWEATKVAALSNRYKNTRNDSATQYNCIVNQVGVLV